MDYTIVASKKDEASSNIASALLSSFDFHESESDFDGEPVFTRGDLKLIFTQRDLVFADHLDLHFSPHAYIFLSRHRSESGTPALTVHFTGNFSDDVSFGGRPRELAHTYPSLLKGYIRSLWSRRDKAERYQITIEATHHGPTSLKRPLLFVELGSAPQQWRDREAGSLIADALMEAVSRDPGISEAVGVGFGGTHYPAKFTRFLIEEDVPLGAVAPRYALQLIDGKMVEQMVSKSIEKVSYAILDWKGLGPERARIVKLIEGQGLEVIRI